MKIYAAMYNPMIHESSFGIISLHKTERGAQMAMEFHRNEEEKRWMEMFSTKSEQEEYPFGKFEAWKVTFYELQD